MHWNDFLSLFWSLQLILEVLKFSFGVVHPAVPSSSTEACALGGHLEMLAWFLKKII